MRNTKTKEKQVALVTGGCGFVGRHLVMNLLHDSCEVWIVDNLFTGKHPDVWLLGFLKKQEKGTTVYTSNKRRVVFIKADAIDFFRDQLKNTPSVKLPSFDEVYHLAAIVGGRAVLIENDPILIATNHVIDSVFFQWAVRNKSNIGTVVYASSSVSYPKTLQDKGAHVVLKEEHLNFDRDTHIGRPESIYGWIKLAGEYLGWIAARKYGVKVAVVRPFSGYGEDQDADYPIPSIAARVARRENPLIVWGSGNQGRDFIHVDDFVSALQVVAKNVDDGTAVNIGMGRLTTFREVAQIMASIEGYKPKIVGLTDKIEGSFALHSDITKLKSFGWKPEYSLEEGFKKVLQSVKQQIG